jgi:hypothetical protein
VKEPQVLQLPHPKTSKTGKKLNPHQNFPGPLGVEHVSGRSRIKHAITTNTKQKKKKKKKKKKKRKVVFDLPRGLKRRPERGEGGVQSNMLWQ